VLPGAAVPIATPNYTTALVICQLQISKLNITKCNKQVHKVLGALLLLVSVMPGLTEHTNTYTHTVLRFGNIATK